LRNDDSMTVLTVPDVRVLEPVHVHVEPVRVDVHVRHEDFVPYTILTITLRILAGLNIIRDIEVLQHTAPTKLFLFYEIAIPLFPKTYPRKPSIQHSFAQSPKP